MKFTAQSNAAWRARDFHPVLNERAATPEAEREAGVLYRLLRLKREHPLPAGAVLPRERFDFSLDRSQSCPSLGEYDAYERDHPLGGMPYGLAPLAEAEYQTLIAWLRNGASVPTASASAPDPAAGSVARWEAFVNGESAKQRVTSRYIYEHLFLAHLHFPEVAPEQIVAAQFSERADSLESVAFAYAELDRRASRLARRLRSTRGSNWRWRRSAPSEHGHLHHERHWHC